VSIVLAGIIILICIILSAFFSGAETALMVADRIRLRHLVEQGNKRALMVQALLARPEKFLGTTLVGTNLSTVGGSVVATWLIGHILGHSSNLVALYQTVIMTIVLLIFAEIVPKNLFRAHADSLVLHLAPWVNISYRILAPVVIAATGLSRLFSRESHSGHRKVPFVSREELRYLTRESQRQGLIEKQEQFIVGQIFSFAETTVQSVMKPLAEVLGTELNSSPPEIVEIIRRAGLSRIPIYEGKSDNIVGVVDISRLLTARRNTPLRKLIYPLSRVRQETGVERLFLKLQKKHEHMALVTNERGAVTGIVTMEDLLEVIVGEIKDEHDEA